MYFRWHKQSTVYFGIRKSSTKLEPKAAEKNQFEFYKLIEEFQPGIEASLFL